MLIPFLPLKAGWFEAPASLPCLHSRETLNNTAVILPTPYDRLSSQCEMGRCLRLVVVPIEVVSSAMR